MAIIPIIIIINQRYKSVLIYESFGDLELESDL